jgi:diguanylate cyclase (GGDEF)-like protein
VTFEQRPFCTAANAFRNPARAGQGRGGRITHIWGMARDLTRFLVSQNALVHLNEQLEAKILQRTRELQEANLRFSELSTTDGLTGIANRRKFDAAISEEWARAARTGTTLSLIMLDIDHFKKYNDHYGHQQGDDCLRRVAEVLRTSARRQGDLVSRYGGEEFCMILPDTGAPGGLEIAERLRTAIEGLNMPHALSPYGRITVSIGLASLAAGDENSSPTLLRLADEALYRAKSEGRNRVRSAAYLAIFSDAEILRSPNPPKRRLKIKLYTGDRHARTLCAAAVQPEDVDTHLSRILSFRSLTMKSQSLAVTVAAPVALLPRLAVLGAGAALGRLLFDHAHRPCSTQDLHCPGA